MSQKKKSKDVMSTVEKLLRRLFPKIFDVKEVKYLSGKNRV